MRAKRCKHPGRTWEVLLLGVLLLLPGAAWAQEESVPAEAGQEGQQPADDKKGDSSTGKAIPGATLAEPPIRDLGGTGVLSDALGSLRWGPIHVRSAEFVQFFDRAVFRDGLDRVETHASVFRTNITIHKRFRRGRIALQYQPRVSVINGEVEEDFSNQDLNFDTFFYLSPRATVSFSNSFVYSGSRSRYGDSFLLTDTTTGATAPEQFLDNSGSLLSNTTGLTFGYQLSARSQISIGPNYAYHDTRGSSQQGIFRSYGMNFNFSHSPAENKTVGLFYSMEKSEFAQSADTLYQTAGFNYTHQLGPAFRFYSSIGASTAASDTNPRFWSAYGNLGFSRSFRKSWVSLTYARDHSFPGYVTDAYHDRVDFSIGVQMSRRLRTSIGAGYFRELRSVHNTVGKYANAQISFHVSPTVSIFVSYIHKRQQGDAREIFSGNRNFALAGIRWTPGRTD